MLLTLADILMRAITIYAQSYLSGGIGAEGMGKLQLIGTARALAMTFGLSGIRVAALNMTAEHAAKGDKIGMKTTICNCIQYALIFSVSAAVILFGFSHPITARWIGDGQLSPVLKIAALELPIDCVTAVLSGYMIARGRIKQTVIAEIIDRLISAILSVAAIRASSNSALGVIAIRVYLCGGLGAIIGFSILSASVRRELKNIPYCPQRKLFRSVLKISLPLAIGDYLRSGLASVKQFLIPFGLRRSGASYYASMHAYGIIGGMVFPVLMFPAALIYSLCDLLISELARCKAQNSHTRIRFLIGQCLGSGIVVNAAIAGWMYLAAPALGILIYHNNEVGQQLQAFSPLIVILYSDALTDGMLKGLGEQVFTVSLNTVTLILDVVLLWVLLPFFGIRGYYISFVVSHFINFLFSLRHLCRVTEYRPRLTRATVTAVATVISVFLCHAITVFHPMFLSLCSASIVYFGIDFLLQYLLGTVSFPKLTGHLHFGAFSGKISKTVRQPLQTLKRTSNPAKAMP